jgi:hypothetical protein
MGLFILVVSVVILFVIGGLISALDNEKTAKRRALEKAQSELCSLQSEYDSAKKYFKQTTEKYEATISEKDELFAQIGKTNTESLEYISSHIADHLTLQYELSAQFLQRKKHPALKEAQRIRELRQTTREIVQRHNMLKYNYELLFQLFPDLELYVDDVESISALSSLDNLDSLQEVTDRTRNYLSPEEYENLSEVERDQLALDRYVASQKSKWQIGRDYELFIGHEYATDGWDVEYFGMEKTLEDLGRDLVVRKDNEIHIVQCKYWSQEKTIREKHVSQLYGTTAQFVCTTCPTQRVVPVLVTNTILSPTAKLFAHHLGVRFHENRPMADFPRIKCNINQDEAGRMTRIYHLPMDQQYDRTKICKRGEFFAFTVQEANTAGFRRAWRCMEMARGRRKRGHH